MRSVPNRLKAVLSLVASCCLTLAATAQLPISRDLSFGTNGAIHIPAYNALATLQPDDKLVVVCPVGPQEFTLRRYTPDGTPDPSLGTNGVVTHSFSGTSLLEFKNLTAPVFQADGKILVAGTVNYDYGPNSFGTEIQSDALILFRFKSNGELDLSFQNTGYYVWRPGVADNGGGPSSFGHYITLQDDGKIVVAGGGYNLVYYPGQGGYTGSYDLCVWRFLPDGSLDLSFNGKGFKGIDYFNSHNGPNAPYSHEALLGIGIKPSGEILVPFHQSISISEDSYWGYYAFSTDGASAGKFSGGLLGGNGDVGIKSMLIQPDGKAVLATSQFWNNYPFLTMKRADLSHELDTSFSFTISSFYEDYPDLYSSFLLTGVSFRKGKFLITGYYADHIGLVSVNQEGEFDYTFNAGEAVFSEANSLLPAFFIPDEALVQSDDNILVTGRNLSGDFLVVRFGNYSPNGLPSVKSPEDVDIYPNPAGDQLLISGNLKATATINLFDISGRNTGRQAKQAGDGRFLMNTSGLAAGVYFLKVRTGSQQIIKQVSILH